MVTKQVMNETQIATLNEMKAEFEALQTEMQAEIDSAYMQPSVKDEMNADVSDIELSDVLVAKLHGAADKYDVSDYPQVRGGFRPKFMVKKLALLGECSNSLVAMPFVVHEIVGHLQFWASLPNEIVVDDED